MRTYSDPTALPECSAAAPLKNAAAWDCDNLLRLESPRPGDRRRDTNSEAVRKLMAGMETNESSTSAICTPRTLESAVAEVTKPKPKSKPTPRARHPLQPVKAEVTNSARPKRSKSAEASTGVPLDAGAGPRWDKLPAEVQASATAFRPAKLGFKKRAVKLRSGNMQRARSAAAASADAAAILEAGLRDCANKEVLAQPANWGRPEKGEELDFVQQIVERSHSNPQIQLKAMASTARPLICKRNLPRSTARLVHSARAAPGHAKVEQRHLMHHQRVAAA